MAAQLGRAAIFAGATAVTGCWTSSTKPHDTNIVEKKTVDPAAVPAGTIRGVVRDAETGELLARFPVTLVAENGAESYATTNERGEYTFAGLEPGNYTVMRRATDPREKPVLGVAVTLEPEHGEQRDFSVQFEAPPPCCKPYGAPPARRRIV